ncbi:RELT-like protein 2 isoform 2-T4 [Vipera latastei]
MSEHSSATDGDVDHQYGLYMLVLLVLVFFVMGLAGFLICHILKKKGYRCRTFSNEFDSDNKESLTQLQDDEDEDEDMNEDTVEKIVKCIIQNEANVEVLKEMLGEGDADYPLPVPVPSALCPHRSSQDGGIPHHHTVHLGSTQAPCIHCSKKKRPSLHRQGRSKEGKSKMHPGETTVFSVGRHIQTLGTSISMLYATVKINLDLCNHFIKNNFVKDIKSK